MNKALEISSINDINSIRNIKLNYNKIEGITAFLIRYFLSSLLNLLNCYY